MLLSSTPRHAIGLATCPVVFSAAGGSTRRRLGWRGPSATLGHRPERVELVAFRGVAASPGDRALEVLHVQLQRDGPVAPAPVCGDVVLHGREAYAPQGWPAHGAWASSWRWVALRMHTAGQERRKAALLLHART